MLQRQDDSGVLTSWKEIATYLGKGVRTVQRWEHELDLPIRRPLRAHKHVVMALPDELDGWMRSRMVARTGARQGGDDEPAQPQISEYVTLIREAHDQLRLARELAQDAERMRTAQQKLLNELRRRVESLHGIAEISRERRLHQGVKRVGGKGHAA